VILVPLFLNIALTLVLDGINCIPSTTLRWALRREGRLDLNFHLRIFTSSKSFAPNAWYTNVVSAIALVMAYGRTSILTYQVFVMAATNAKGQIVSNDVPGPRFALDFNAWGCIGLGIGLVLQAIIATACLIMSGGIVPTWNSNPLGTARACVKLGDYGVKSSTLRSVSFDYSGSTVATSPNRTVLSRPRSRQPPMTKYAPQVRLITNVVWLIATIISLWTIAVGIVAWRQGSTTADYVSGSTGNTSALSYWQLYGQIGIKYTKDAYNKRKDWLGMIIQCIVLSMMTLGLHAVESITQVMRDEAIWRKAATVGVNPNRGAVLEGFSNGTSWLLFAMKSLNHWIFGYAFSMDVRALMNLLPMIALSVCFILLALMAECIIRWKPKGLQPATYGDIERLLALVDDWDHDRIFWGDKGMSLDGVRLAGTAGRRQADLLPEAWYANITADSWSDLAQVPVSEIGQAA
jgi:hypothetical protein